MEQKDKEKEANHWSRDHGVFPDVILNRDVYVDGELWGAEGEVLDKDRVAFAYSREGRRILGLELPNPVPLEPPLGYFDAVPIHIQIREMIQGELSRRAAEAGEETFEEADDFDVDDDQDPMSPWELEYEPTRPWKTALEVQVEEYRAAEAAKRADKAREELEKAAATAPAPPTPPDPEPPAKPAKGKGKSEESE